MTRDADRAVVRTNGRRPTSTGTPAADDDAIESVDAADAVDEVQTVAFTPTQLTVGFGILAALILLLVRRRRGKP